MPFKKGSKEAKEHMLKLRNMRLNGSQTKLSFSKTKPKKKSEFPIKPKKVYKQTGTSDTFLDKLKKALPPGKRIAKNTGVTYYEVRKNHSDAKGKLTGVGSIHTDILNKDILKDYEYSKKQISIFEIVLNNHKLAIVNPENRVYKAQLTRQKKQIETYIKEMKEHVKQLKKML